MRNTEFEFVENAAASLVSSHSIFCCVPRAIFIGYMVSFLFLPQKETLFKATINSAPQVGNWKRHFTDTHIHACKHHLTTGHCFGKGKPVIFQDWK